MCESERERERERERGEGPMDVKDLAFNAFTLQSSNCGIVCQLCAAHVHIPTKGLLKPQHHMVMELFVKRRLIKNIYIVSSKMFLSCFLRFFAAH